MIMKHTFGSKEYFDELYANSKEPWGFSYRASQQYRYKLCIQLLKQFSASYKSVLDIGCSQGQFTVILQGVATKIVAIDISEKAIQRAKNRHKEYKNIKFEVGSLPLLRYDNDSFDLATALEVLYYLGEEDRIRALKEIKRILTKDGLLLISVNINKPPYFQIDEFYNLIDQFFKIKKVKYNYGKIYSFFEEKLLVLDRTPLKKLAHYILSIEILVRIGQLLTKLIFGRKGITHVCILAQNKQ